MLKKLFLFIFLSIGVQAFSQQIYKRTLKLMGSRFDITVVAQDSVEAHKHIDLAVKEISRIENSFLLGIPTLKLRPLIKMLVCKPQK